MDFESWQTAIDSFRGGTLVLDNFKLESSYSWSCAQLQGRFASSKMLRFAHDDGAGEAAAEVFRNFRQKLLDARTDEPALAMLSTGDLSLFCETLGSDVPVTFSAVRVENLPRFLNLVVSNIADSQEHRTIFGSIGDWNDDDFEEIEKILRTLACNETLNESEYSNENLERSRMLWSYLSEFSKYQPKTANLNILPEPKPRKDGLQRSSGVPVRNGLPSTINKKDTYWFSPIGDEDLLAERCAVLDDAEPCASAEDLTHVKAQCGLIDPRDFKTRAEGGSPEYHFSILMRYELRRDQAFRPSVWADGFLESFLCAPQNTAYNYGRAVCVDNQDYGSIGAPEVVALAENIDFTANALKLMCFGYVPVALRNKMLKQSDHVERIRHQNGRAA
ncbi:hypothetical protein [uncultured Tateyamaria sp.]|uniref:hypothetical protein n=1 Tax=uncultured Tateyamaria sp. TaxID=455651 RepID=UPI002614B4ED|nr:hypothetical protein [uncultured Tateyamaria sp.]